MIQQTSALVRVSVEPRVPQQLQAVRRGLELLRHADPFVEVDVTEAGELILAAAGEVHLETCLKDLAERFARVPLIVSPPLVAFKESIALPAEEERIAVNGIPARSVQHAYLCLDIMGARCGLYELDLFIFFHFISSHAALVTPTVSYFGFVVLIEVDRTGIQA